MQRPIYWTPSEQMEVLPFSLFVSVQKKKKKGLSNAVWKVNTFHYVGIFLKISCVQIYM